MFDLLFFAAPGTVLRQRWLEYSGLLIEQISANVVIHRLPRIAEREYDDAPAENLMPIAKHAKRALAIGLCCTFRSPTKARCPLPH